MTAGPRAGAQFVLDAGRQNRIGRGLECDVVLTDPLSSRVHAIVVCEERRVVGSRRRQPQWHVRERAEDRRGPPGRRRSLLKSARPSSSSASRQRRRPTRARARPHANDRPRPQRRRASDTGNFGLDALRDARAGPGPSHAAPAQHAAAGLHRPRRSDSRLARPAARADAGLGRRLSVGQRRRPAQAQARHSRRRRRQGAAQPSRSPRWSSAQGKAVWIDNQQRKAGDRTASAALCRRHLRAARPRRRRRIGAIHLYLEKGRFRQSDFDVAIPLANILTVALVRARREAVLAGRASPPGGQVRRLRRADRRQQADARPEIENHPRSPGPPAAC